jgi:hypothetical protein
LVPPPKVEKHRLLPAEVRQTILDAKREHPPLNVHEITTVCWALGPPAESLQQPRPAYRPTRVGRRSGQCPLAHGECLLTHLQQARTG